MPFPQRRYGIPGCIKQTIKRPTEMVFALFSALLSLYLECYDHIWAPQYKRDQDVLERVFKRATKNCEGLVESLRELRLERKEVTREFYPVSYITSYTLNIQNCIQIPVFIILYINSYKKTTKKMLCYCSYHLPQLCGKCPM